MFLVALLLLAACAAAGTGPTAPPIEDLAELHGHQGSLALVHASVLTMDDGARVERDRTVVIRDGRIVSVGPTVTTDPPTDVRVVDVHGRYIVPGLADMHVHLRRQHVPSFLRSGITLVRDLWGHDETLALRDEARQGGHVPWVVATGPGIDGSPPVRPTPALLERPEDAARLVAEVMDGRWDALKVYQNLRQDSFLALFDAAQAAGVNLVGHVPTDVPLEKALGRMRSIEHLEGYDQALVGYRLQAFRSWVSVKPNDMALWARRTVDSGTWNTPTLVVIGEALSNHASSGDADRAMKNVRLMVRYLHEAGAPLLAGTDAGVPVVAPGGSLHDELDQLVAAGLSPYDALAAATVNPARFLGLRGEVGVVKGGGRADLLLLEADPLENLRTMRSPTAVILRGRFLVPDSIAE
jgi:imidazolonepropionase-like amidohydrolase